LDLERRQKKKMTKTAAAAKREERTIPDVAAEDRG
jgi:hypothetical protein